MFAGLNNHYHIVVKLGSTDDLSDDEIITRWLTLHKGPLLVQRLLRGDQLEKVERETVNDIIAVWRQRLASLSWFMKCLNEPIAREANREDQCTGHFWESRFKSQALLSDEALLSCMAYVDLNPIRAKMAKTPEDSDYTSVQERITPQFDLAEAIRSQQNGQQLNNFSLPIKPLLHFDDTIKQETQTGLPFSLSDYLQLVDWTGRIVKKNKRGYIPENLPPILVRLAIPPDQWLTNSQYFEKVIHRRFKNAA